MNSRILKDLVDEISYLESQLVTSDSEYVRSLIAKRLKQLSMHIDAYASKIEWRDL